jgi:hypothetical protein
MSGGAPNMPALLQTQQLARALLAQGVSGEIVCSGDGFTVVVDDEHQLEIAAAVVAKYFPGKGHVVHRSI